MAVHKAARKWAKTVAELHLGVPLTTTAEHRSRRLQTAAAIESLFEPLGVDLDVARRYAALGAETRVAD